MTQHLNDRKKRIIREIMKINDESSLEAIEHQLAVESSALRTKILRPARTTISLEEMIREQNYQPIEREAFFELAAAVNIEESIEELLAQLD